METSTYNPVGESTPPQTTELVPTDLGPITRIGVETELSKYPIHNLAKKGSVNIQIVKKTLNGQINLKWEVSYNERYGQPRQLAYKLDTIIINRRIDEERRPLPKLIKLGSLREIASELGVGEKNTNKVKQALRQDASAFIIAKIKYKLNDGTERWLEADFTRYTVIFTGQKLPDGRTADAVYIELHPRFQEVLNNAPIRPLNYEYLKLLKPAAQRFYEIISSRIYATLKNRNPLAKLLYSDFCTCSALTRHFDYENFRVQMAKIHRPHLRSGYITKAHYEATTDGEGRVDWMMCYVPGPKAKAEYLGFTRKDKKQTITSAAQPADMEQGRGETPRESSHRRHGPRQRRLNLRPEEPPPATQSINPELLSALTSRGIGEVDARQLLATLPADQPILDQLEWGDFQIQQYPDKFKNPPGFYFSLLQRDVRPPATFETSRARKARQGAILKQQQAIQEARAREEAREQEQRQKAEARLAALTPEQYQILFNRCKAELMAQHPFMARQKDASRIHEGAIRGRMLRYLGEQPMDVLVVSQPPAPSAPESKTPATTSTRTPAPPESPAPTQPGQSGAGEGAAATLKNLPNKLS